MRYSVYTIISRLLKNGWQEIYTFDNYSNYWTFKKCSHNHVYIVAVNRSSYLLIVVGRRYRLASDSETKSAETEQKSAEKTLTRSYSGVRK